MEYSTGPADRLPVPRHYRTERRYLGYAEADLARPYARFFEPRTRPVQDHVQRALVSGMAAPELAYDLDEVAERLAQPGHEPMETGWTRRPSGAVAVHVLTDMPGVTARMWDWWFGWHSTESARYKLWNPDAHQFAAIADDRSARPGLTDREKYVGNVSFVDEYIGGALQPLAIRFVDPADLGIAEAADTTHVCARVSLSNLPVAFGWLVHQVRPTDRGSQMRSRFFLNVPELLDLPGSSLSSGSFPGGLLNRAGARHVVRAALPHVVPRLMPRTIGPDMVFHCAAEMNHLAGFLPELYAEFRGSR